MRRFVPLRRSWCSRVCSIAASSSSRSGAREVCYSRVMAVAATSKETALARQPLRLLPRSGIGVDDGDLVIAPPGNPVIRLDARLLDRVELIGRSPVSAAVTSGVAALGAIAGAAAILPGSIFTVAGFGYLA